MEFDQDDVVIDDSKILEFSMSANLGADLDDDGSKVEVSYTSSPVKTDGNRVYLDLSVSVKSLDAPTYDVSMRTRTMFVFPEGVDGDARDEYLRASGTSRAFDFARVYIRTATSSGVYGPLDIPYIPAPKTRRD